MRYVWGIVACFIVNLVMISGVHAAATTTPPVDYYSPVFITAFQTSPGELDAVELYTDEEVVNLSSWSVKASDSFNNSCTVNLSSYLVATSYVIAGDDDFNGTDTTGNVRSYGGCVLGSSLQITKLELLRNGHTEEVLGPITSLGFYARDGVTKTYRTGDFVDDFSNTKRNVFYAGQWYDPLPTTPMRITEIMPHAKDCSPLDTLTVGCFDYVKLYNPLNSEVTLDGTRLRIGYQAQNVTTSNTIVLSGVLGAKSYGIIATKADGDSLAITDGGGWVWLEDTYGVTTYDSTVVAYPSASSSTKIGWAWAHDPSVNTWKWTSQPTPFNQPSVFKLPVPGDTNTNGGTLVPCRSDQYRNPLTNRCKLKESSTSSLEQCASNQYRNPATNRCRLIASSSSDLTPCASNQYRNPETNRCKLIASAASQLKPCAANQERNPETNRCRKTSLSTIPTADSAVKGISDSSNSSVGWLAFAGVGSLAAGYGIWEWRREIKTGLARIVGLFTSR